MTKEEFDNSVRETVDTLLLNMAEHPEVDPEKFYSMACILENLAFFSPIIFSALQSAKKVDERDS